MVEVREDLLHYAWQFQAFGRAGLATTDGQPIEVLQPGQHNRAAGPDFAQAVLTIGGLRWAGAVECHVLSSDWARHGHSADPAYARVVLHVVWQHDQDVYLPDGTCLPVLELRGLLTPHLLARYRQLMERLAPGPACLPQLALVPPLVATAMQERALLERLQAKAEHLEALYQASGRDWEETAYRALAYAWGLPANGHAFLQLAEALPMRQLRRLAGQPLSVEALLLGQAGLLGQPEPEPADALTAAFEARARYHTAAQAPPDAHQDALLREYAYQAGRLRLPPPPPPGTLATGRMRPAQQPALRLAQLAALLANTPPLFDLMRSYTQVAELVAHFRVTASGYWQLRYNFGPAGKCGSPTVGHAQALSLVANAVAPLLAAYGRQRNQTAYVHQALSLLEQLPPEHNHLTKPFTDAGLSNQNAAQSQGWLGVQKLYCQPQKCLQCQIGGALLRQAA